MSKEVPNFNDQSLTRSCIVHLEFGSLGVPWALGFNEKTAVSLSTAAVNKPLLVLNYDGGVALRIGREPGRA